MSTPLVDPELGWFSESGALYDVVVSSRQRVSRNVSGFRFPGVMDAGEARAVEEAVRVALEPRSDMPPIRADKLGEHDRRLLVERNLLPPGFGVEGSGLFFLSGDGATVVTVNDRDHLRITALHAGFEFESVYERCASVEHRLDGDLRFAATLDWGYLTAKIGEVGVGMRLSALLHLPALETGGELLRRVREATGDEVRVQAFPGVGGESLGALYLVANRAGIGRDERQTREKVEDCVAALVHYERDEREQLLQAREVELHEGVAQALEVVQHGKRVGDAEMFQLLSWIRLGITTGIYDGARLEDVTSLFFGGQRVHVMQRAGLDEDGDIELVNERRAQLLREVLGRGR